MSRWPGNSQKEKTTFGGLSRGQLMSRVRSTGNKTTENRLIFLLRRAGLSGWRRHRPILGKPDFAWEKVKVVVFVDGCFWHGHKCGKNINPKTNVEAWRDKIQHNKKRDLLVNNLLKKQGWRVVRIWECELAKKPNICIEKIRKAMKRQK
ncbi:MAG: very short patch repair endonuclease [Pirellulales bacterium]|nr:very short patch repair endonuclease [Pirellulales bacterium]